jgi:hypothetical protein
VNVVDPEDATGISPTWSMCPAVEAVEYVDGSEWSLVSIVSPSLEVPTYPVEVREKPSDEVSALATDPFSASRSPLAESVPPVLPIPSLSR